MIVTLFLPLHVTKAEEVRDETIYYILVDRFVNGDSSNDGELNIEDSKAFHGGDLDGVMEKIPDLKKLGITTINLSPIMSTNAYHGFSTLDHQTIHKSFGSIVRLKQLVEQAHKEEMKVILDFVADNVAPNHPLASDQDSTLFGEQVATIDTRNEQVQQYLLEAASYWLKEANIDGFHLYLDGEADETFIQAFEHQVKEEKENAIVLVDGAEEGNLVVNHEFQNEAVALLKQAGTSLKPLFDEEDFLQSDQILSMETVFSNRFAFESMQEEYHPVTRWKLAATLLYALPGSAFFYQGLEVPMDNGVAEPDHRMAELNKEDEEITQHLEKLATIHRESKALSEGDMEFVEQVGEMTVFKRTYQDETLYVAINNDTQTQTATIENLGSNKQLKGLLEDNLIREQEDGSYKITLNRETSNIFVLEENTGLNWFFIAMMIVIFGGFVAFVIALNRRAKKGAGTKE